MKQYFSYIIFACILRSYVQLFIVFISHVFISQRETAKHNTLLFKLTVGPMQSRIKVY